MDEPRYRPCGKCWKPVKIISDAQWKAGCAAAGFCDCGGILDSGISLHLTEKQIDELHRMTSVERHKYWKLRCDPETGHNTAVMLVEERGPAGYCHPPAAGRHTKT